jgi:hypothetical protein
VMGKAALTEESAKPSEPRPIRRSAAPAAAVPLVAKQKS